MLTISLGVPFAGFCYKLIAGITVKHILRSGELVAHAELLERLLEEEKLAQPDPFEPHDVRIKAALAKRESAIAWRDPIMAGSRDTE